MKMTDVVGKVIGWAVNIALAAVAVGVAALAVRWCAGVLTG